MMSGLSCSNNKPDIICLVETRLCEDVKMFWIQIRVSNYSILRTDTGVVLSCTSTIAYCTMSCCVV